MKHYDRLSGKFISDDSISPLKGERITNESLLGNLDKYILSVAGWRTVFAQSGNEEDFSSAVSDVDLVTSSICSAAFFEYLGKENPRILVGADARPTGTLLLDVVTRTFVSLGADVDNIFISSAPEIMAYSNDGFDGFFYISASHNPVGHNGLKFGRQGGVFGKKECDAVLSIFKKLLSSEDIIERAIGWIEAVPMDKHRRVLLDHDRSKFRAMDYYMDFVLRTAGADSSFKIPFGIVAELNGSARSSSIDIPFLTRMGAKVWAVNAIPSQIDHEIVPEGDNLELCRRVLEERYSKDNDYILGYVPDNDGDRGNFVYIDQESRKARILHAQDVFTLISLIEVAHQSYKGERNIAIAANGPTSTRIDELASKFGATVFRADIGEANVVALAENLRRSGYSVHVCGEGSNGGIITEPAKVRDPMNSIMSIAKLYSVPGLFSYICDRIGLQDRESISLASLIKAIPRYITTSAFEREAVLRVRSRQFEPLKRVYEELFLLTLESHLSDKLHSYEVHQFEGYEENVGFGSAYRDTSSAGGYKVIFFDKNGEFSAYLWLSKSKTEPVMRIMADVKGNDYMLYEELLSWQKHLVERADSAIE